LFETDYFKIRISRSKTDQGGRGEWVFVPKNPHGFLDPHMLLCIYLHKMGFDNCPGEVYLFPPLAWDAKAREHGIVTGKKLSYAAAYKCFKTLLSSAGLDPRKFGLHSPRIGAATDAFFNKVPDYVIDLQGRWKSHATKYRYLRLDEKRLVDQIQFSSRY